MFWAVSCTGGKLVRIIRNCRDVIQKDATVWMHFHENKQFQLFSLSSLLQPPLCWARLLGRQSMWVPDWGSLWRRENMGDGPSTLRGTQRGSATHFYTVKEASGGSVTPWEHQVVGKVAETKRTAPYHQVAPGNFGVHPGFQRDGKTMTPPSPWPSPPSPPARWWEWQGEAMWWRSMEARDQRVWATTGE